MKKWSLVLVALFGIFIIGIIAAVIAFIWATQPINPQAQEKSQFVIARGQSINKIGERLTEAGFIRHPLIFRAIVMKNNLGSKLQAGSFLLSPSMSVSEIGQELTKGTSDLWITLLEGWRVEEIADALAQKPELTEFNKQEFLELAQSDEGYLFPDTYLVPRAITSESAYHLFRDTFETKVETGLADEIAASSLPLEKVVILASLIEREARGAEQMRQVSGILHNRIKDGMALNVDATLQYLKGYDKAQQSWWVPPLAVDKQVDSPFNTYKNAGLPPKPIANPGLDAIKAALNPAKTDNYYYLHAPDGSIHYGKTLDEHNANVQKYLR